LRKGVNAIKEQYT